MTEWSYLPNARHIDRVLASLKKHPHAWAAAWDASRDTPRGPAWGAAVDAARSPAWGAAMDAAWDTARGPARSAAADAVGALIAWDDCEVYLSTPLEAFPLLISTTNHAAVLLYPAAIVFSKEPS